jgi:outer membrane biosynthesis protein TonB
MTYVKTLFLLFIFAISGCYDAKSPEKKQVSSVKDTVSTESSSSSNKATTASQEIAMAQNKNTEIREKISELEKRRLAMEAKRLAAEEKRLAAAEKRLAAAEKRLAAEERRLASEEKKLIAQENPFSNTNTTNQSQDTQSKKDTKVEIKPAVVAVDQPVLKERKKVKSVVSTTKNPAFIKLENQYYLDLYKWELKTEIYRLVTYPDWAKSLGKTGTVSLNFTVNRDTQVSNVHGDNPRISIQLVSELHRSIIAAAKRVLPPDALPGDSWNMSISYNFQPHDVEQLALQKPVKPLFLEREHSIVLIDSDNNLEKYKKDVQNIISETIEYPVWAEKLKQRGKVSFEIVVNQDGSIAEITPKDVNRHQFLNQEVLRAINDSTPLPSIPEHLRLQSTNMLIQHDFRR